eukprot:364691-Chlamydomonas_euryale.AAC.4
MLTAHRPRPSCHNPPPNTLRPCLRVAVLRSVPAFILILSIQELPARRGELELVTALVGLVSCRLRAARLGGCRALWVRRHTRASVAVAAVAAAGVRPKSQQKRPHFLPQLPAHEAAVVGQLS